MTHQALCLNEMAFSSTQCKCSVMSFSQGWSEWGTPALHAYLPIGYEAEFGTSGFGSSGELDSHCYVAHIERHRETFLFLILSIPHTCNKAELQTDACTQEGGFWYKGSAVSIQCHCRYPEDFHLAATLSLKYCRPCVTTVRSFGCCIKPIAFQMAL